MIAKNELRPGSPLVVFAFAAFATAWIVVRPASRAARRFAIALVVLYWLLTTRAGPAVLMAALSDGSPPVRTAHAAAGVDTIVVLGGGGASLRSEGVVIGVPSRGTVLRALEGAAVYRAIGAKRIVASGGAVVPGLDLTPESAMIRTVLLSAGVSADRIVEESASRSTREQARAVKRLLGAERRLVLVTSATHMRRAVAAFRAAALDPIASPAPISSENLPPPSWIWPNGEALYRSDVATYDCAAWLYYWSTGALKPGPPAAR